jgi:DNA-binding GntR family transcriptional regulator
MPAAKTTLDRPSRVEPPTHGVADLGAGGERTRRKGDVDADDAAYQAIRRAIQSGRLPPGLKLQEPTLARLLGVSRERVRKALHRLAHERWLDVVPNRGSFVPSPTVDELHAIYEARRILETGVVRLAAQRVNAAASRRLLAHVHEEARAARAGDRAEVFRLSSLFHSLLAETTGNDELGHALRSLAMRSSLHASLYAPMPCQGCAGRTSTA